MSVFRFANFRPRDYAALCVRIFNGLVVPIGVNAGTDCRVYWLSYMCTAFSVEHVLLCLYAATYYWDTNKVSSIQGLCLLGITIPVRMPHRIDKK